MAESSRTRRHWPLYVRILIGVALGAIVGAIWHDKVKSLGEIGMLVIRLLKALATPLILFAVLDAFMRTPHRTPPIIQGKVSGGGGECMRADVEIRDARGSSPGRIQGKPAREAETIKHVAAFA